MLTSKAPPSPEDAQADALDLDALAELLETTRPGDERVVARLCEVLAQPRPLPQVEEVEGLVKELWRRRLAAGIPAQALAADFVRFFHRLGFLAKHKPYGVKLATPFGYSLFALAPGEGFSFQRHLVPKSEVFSVLAAAPGGRAWLSTEAEWAAWGREVVLSGRTDGPGWLQLQAGDVLEVLEAGLVHTVLGCTLEEFAVVSVDAVDRLHDQNQGRPTVLPSRSLEPAALLEGLDLHGGRRRATRTPEGWAFATLPGAGRLTLGAAPGIHAEHLHLAPGTSDSLAADPTQVGLVVLLRGTLEVEVAGLRLVLQPGQVAPVPPGHAARLSATAGPALASLHRVSAEAALSEWA